MHLQSPPLTIGGTVLKESDGLVILGVTFDSKLTLEKRLRFVSRATSQRLGILRKSGQVFHDRSLLERWFRGFVLPVLETVLQCGARLPIHTLNYWTACSQWCPIPNWGVFECDIAHRRSVAVLCMLHKIKCNPMHPLNDSLPGPYMPVWVTRGALVTHWYLMRHLSAEPRRTAGLLFPSQCNSATILLTPYSMVWDWRVSRAGRMVFYWPKLFYPYYSRLLFFAFSSSCLKVGFVGLGSSD